MCWLLAGGSMHYELPMDHVLAGNRIVNPSGLDARVSGYATFVRGARARGLLVDGRNSYIRVSGPGHRHECFGDLSKCPDGAYHHNVLITAAAVNPTVLDGVRFRLNARWDTAILDTIPVTAGFHYSSKLQTWLQTWSQTCMSVSQAGRKQVASQLQICFKHASNKIDVSG